MVREQPSTYSTVDCLYAHCICIHLTVYMIVRTCTIDPNWVRDQLARFYKQNLDIRRSDEKVTMKNASTTFKRVQMLFLE